ncbi:MAG: hypothetical protein XD95_0412 [Microgenomates bacterium 39_7]|nr:MAG: hypothetical protein XD95_0412 [Microgenomates bacterium 39_7]
MKNIFKVSHFEFPYDYKFPGQSTDERILFVTRENKLSLVLKQLFIICAALSLLVAGIVLKQFISNSFGLIIGGIFEVFLLLLIMVFVLIGWWWVVSIWKKSIALVTTKRLIKFIYSTPASRYSLALPLEMIVDTGAYTKGFLQTFLRLETFTARSSASSSGVATDDPSRVNKKYFYIENIKRAEDLQHYVSKLLDARQEHKEKMQTFRPFVMNLKGEDRANFIKQNFPEFWS